MLVLQTRQQEQRQQDQIALQLKVIPLVGDEYKVQTACQRKLFLQVLQCMQEQSLPVARPEIQTLSAFARPRQA